MGFRISIFSFMFACASALATPVFAHRPFIDAAPTASGVTTAAIPDPTGSSVAVYGALNRPGEVHIYMFTAGADAELPVEALVPVRPSLRHFAPTAVLLGETVVADDLSGLSFRVPEPGFGAFVVPPPSGARRTFYEPFSAETLYHGTEAPLDVAAGKRYAVAIFDPSGRTGDFVLSIGSAENFNDVSWFGLVGGVLRLKFGLAGRAGLPISAFIGLLMIMSGLAAAVGIRLAAGAFVLRLPRGSRAVAWLKNVRELRHLGWAGESAAALGAILLFADNGFTGMAPLLPLPAAVIVGCECWIAGRFVLSGGRRVSVTPRTAFAVIVLDAVSWAMAAALVAWQTIVLR